MAGTESVRVQTQWVCGTRASVTRLLRQSIMIESKNVYQGFVINIIMGSKNCQSFWIAFCLLHCSATLSCFTSDSSMQSSHSTSQPSSLSNREFFQHTNYNFSSQVRQTSMRMRLELFERARSCCFDSKDSTNLNLNSIRPQPATVPVCGPWEFAWKALRWKELQQTLEQRIRCACHSRSMASVGSNPLSFNACASCNGQACKSKFSTQRHNQGYTSDSAQFIQFSTARQIRHYWSNSALHVRFTLSQKCSKIDHLTYSHKLHCVSMRSDVKPNVKVKRELQFGAWVLRDAVFAWACHGCPSTRTDAKHCRSTWQTIVLKLQFENIWGIKAFPSRVMRWRHLSSYVCQFVWHRWSHGPRTILFKCHDAFVSIFYRLQLASSIRHYFIGVFVQFDSIIDQVIDQLQNEEKIQYMNKNRIRASRLSRVRELKAA